MNSRPREPPLAPFPQLNPFSPDSPAYPLQPSIHSRNITPLEEPPAYDRQEESPAELSFSLATFHFHSSALCQSETGQIFSYRHFH